MIDLSVIIVGFKNYKIVLDCLESINKYNDIGSALEVILIDNSPNHDVYNAVVERCTGVISVKNENKGFGAGNNAGAALAKGKYLLFLNPDTILVEPIFKFAIDKFNNDDRLSMFGIRLISESHARNHSFYLINAGGIFRSLLAKACNRTNIYVDGVMYIAGADMFVRNVDFVRCGRFDENIFMYYEEPDLTIRLRSLGKKTAYYSNKTLVHLEGGTTPDSSLALRRRLDSLFYYNKKHFKGSHSSFFREYRYLYLKLLISRFFGIGDYVRLSNEVAIFKEYISLRVTGSQPV